MCNKDIFDVNSFCRFEANPSIADMQRYLPIHYAVLGNHEAVLDVFGEHFPLAYVVCFIEHSLTRNKKMFHSLNLGEFNKFHMKCPQV